MTFSTPKRRSGLPSPASSILSSNRKSKLQTPQSRRRLTSQLTSKISASRIGGSTSSSCVEVTATTIVPDDTLEAAKGSLDESSYPLPEKEAISDDIAYDDVRTAARRLLEKASVSSVASSTHTTVAAPANAEEAVRVGVRIRPMLEADNEPRAFVLGSSANTIVKNVGPEISPYHFKHVYGERSSTEQLYSEMVYEIVESVVYQGRNGTVFTYGQTSTGKTYSMHGILRAAGSDLFGMASDSDDDNRMSSPDSESVTTTVQISCMELYNEELRDLLCDGSHSSLSIQEDRRGNVQIPGVIERTVANVDELMEVIQIADENRTIGSTAMNDQSSRSHTIYGITYTKKKIGKAFCGSVDDSGEESDEDKENEQAVGDGAGQKIRQKVTTTVSTLNLVDLAGSESVRLTGAKGERQKEGGKINQSLLTLSRVLEKLGKKDRGHIGYRDSKLTRILKPSLSGNARMACICCISPEIQYAEESKSTLDFASRTMLVTTNAKRNESIEYDNSLVEQYEREIERVKMQASEAEERRREMEQTLQEAEDRVVCLKASLELEKCKVSTLERQHNDHVKLVEEIKATGAEENEKLLREIEHLKTSLAQCETENNTLKLQREEDREERTRVDEEKSKEAERHMLELEGLKDQVLSLKKQKEEAEAKHSELQSTVTLQQEEMHSLTATNAEDNDELIGRITEMEYKNKVLLEELEKVKEDNKASQEEITALKSDMAAIAEEKLRVEWKLAREMQKTQKRRDEAKERRQRFKGKLADMAETMKGSLKDDLVEVSYQKEF